MRAQRLLILSLCATLLLTGCSTVETSKPATSLATIRNAQRYQLLVRTGNAVLDKLVYEFAYAQFDDVLPLREKEPYTGTMEITFVSSSQSAFIGSSISTVSGRGSGSGWYTAGGYVGGASVTGTAASVTTGTMLEWQNSTMIIVLKAVDGERLWTADYNYKGGWEFSGFVVNTPDEAARLVLKRLKEKFKSDFGLN